MSKQQRLIWVTIFLGATILGLISAYFALISTPADASGWWQVVIAAFGIPVLFYELSRLRRSLEQKPALSIGLAGVKDMPFSNIRQMKVLPTAIRVSRGYPHILLLVRNSGDVSARFVKIYLEFKKPDVSSLAVPTVKVCDWLGDNRYSFKQESNVDFIFVGGSDWVIHPNDTEVFSFQMSTALVKQKEPIEIRERPAPGSYIFHCTVWAEGLNSPVGEQLTVEVAE